jgi:hypothetical protein
MDTLLYANLDRGLVSASASVTPFVWPALVQGDDVRAQLRFTRTLAAGVVEVRPEVEGVRLSIGKVDARPVSGAFKLLVDGAVTASLDFDASAAEVEAALTAHDAAVGEVTGGWVVTFEGVAADDDAIEIELGDSSLAPACFLLVRTYPLDGLLAHELRLVQAPVAFTSTFSRVVPAAPAVSEIQAGGEADGVTWNEVQKLYVDPRFVGTYQLRWDYRRTIPLTTADGAEEIQAALMAIAKEGEAWTVGNPDQNTAYIEFTGEDFVGIDHPLLEVFVVDAPEGDVTIDLDLDTPGVAALLRAGDSTAEAIIELEVTISEDEVSRTYTVCRDAMTLRRELNRAQMEALTPINWVRPPGPRDYGAYDWSQVVTGDQTLSATVGNGVARVFEVTHSFGLAVRVDVMETSGERILPNGVAYTATRTATTVTVTLLSGEATPATDALTVLVTGFSERTQYAPHTHPIDGVVGLNAALEAFADRISNLEDLAPTGALAARVDDVTVVAAWELPAVGSVYPAREEVAMEGSLLDLDVSKIRPGGLLAAVQTTAAVLTLPVPLPTAALTHAGKLYRNEGAAAVRLPGGGGRRGYDLPVNGLASVIWNAEKGTGMWYPVERYGSTDTYYPVQFEVPLFEFVVLAEQFRAKRRFTVDLGCEAAILRANARAQWVLAIEYGTLGTTSTPGTQGPNFSGITWLTTTPAVDQRIYLSPVPTTHRLGLTIDRDAAGDLTAMKRLYGDTVSTVAPAAAAFAIRGRLTRFDPGAEAAPTGLVAVRGLNVRLGEESGELGIAKIY